MAYDFDRIIDRRSSDCEKWSHYGEGVLPLWVADMDFQSPEPVIRALRERVEHGIFGYGCEPAEFREVLVERLQRLYGWQVTPEALVFLPGVVVGFRVACRAATCPGDGVLIQTPVYPPILRAWSCNGLAGQENQLLRQPNGRYTIDFDAFADVITDRTRIFLLCNPHNPVGRVFNRPELERLADISLRHDLVICSDEIHCDLVFRGSPHIPIASLAPEIGARTITLIAPSKTYNIAGLQCAVAVIENPELRRRFLAAQGGVVPHPSILGFLAGLVAYRDGQEWLDAVLRYLEDNRDLLYQYVNAELPGIHMGRPEGTYLAWLDCREARLPGSPFEFFLQRARVALNDGRTFGGGGEGFVRLNFGCPRSILSEALERMKAALSGR